MTENQTDDGRTETKRWVAAGVDATDLIVGDRIAPKLVARTMSGLGTRVAVSPPDDPAPNTQFAAATDLDTSNSVHSAILVDGETGVMARATRHSTHSAMAQKEADWKVRGLGQKLTVEDAEVVSEGEGWSFSPTAAAEAESWGNAVLQDRALGFGPHADELFLNGRPELLLWDPWTTRRLRATVSLETDDSP